MTEHEQMLITKYDLLFESRLTKVETTLENLEKHLQSFESKYTILFGMMGGLYLTVIGSLITILIKLVH